MSTAAATAIRPVTFGQVHRFIKDKIRETNPGWAANVSKGMFADEFANIISYEANVGHSDGAFSNEGILSLKISEGLRITALEFITKDDLLDVEFTNSKRDGYFYNADCALEEKLPDEFKGESWQKVGVDSPYTEGDKIGYLQSLSVLSKLVHNR